MKSVLISGITGFIGKNLKPYLSGKYNIQGTSRKVSDDYISNDSIDVNSFNENFAFIHLAGKAHDLKNEVGADVYYEVNRDLTIKMFDLFLQSDCKIFIYLSSVKAVADTIEGVLTEDTKATPTTPYGKSKLQAEEYLLNKKLTDGKSIYILRPCMVHGPENKGNLNLLYKFVTLGIPYPLGKFENQRSFASIENLCFIINACLEQTIKSGVYNVSDDETISTKELVTLIAETRHKKVRIYNVNKKIVRSVAKVCGFFKLPMDTHRLDKMVENFVVSNEKIRKEVKGKLPLKTKEGLVKTIKSFQ
tara:strand:+ start:910 stop:1824 length:915 start_codon:yes stop_codon:yes gene_type:complete